MLHTSPALEGGFGAPEVTAEPVAAALLPVASSLVVTYSDGVECRVWWCGEWKVEVGGGTKLAQREA